MKSFVSLLLLVTGTHLLWAQVPATMMQYEPSEEFPFGRPNPEAPAEITDFAPMIGECDCWSLSRNPDGSWQDTLQMVWRFKYIMNGTAIQDEVWRENGLYAGSIRQYQADSAKWVVSYFSYPGVTTTPGVWLGEKVGEEIVLRMPQQAPNGMDGFSRLTFFDFRETGYSWKGEWVNPDESIVYAFWQIGCRQRKSRQ